MQTDQILQLSAFVDAEVDYHRQSVDTLQRLLESLRERSVCACCLQGDTEKILVVSFKPWLDYHRQSVDTLQRLLESLRERSVQGATEKIRLISLTHKD